MAPTDEDKDQLLDSCRYGDLDEVQDFVKQFGQEPLADVRDANDNSILHMVCGNGHLGGDTSHELLRHDTLYLIFARCNSDVLNYLLPIIPTSLLAAQNNARSTPLHWAALNSHLSIAQTLVDFPGGPGVDLIDIKNVAGRSPLAEAELAGWEEGAKWLVQMMKLDAAIIENEGDVEESGAANGDDGALQKVEVEIEDADGHMAKLSIGGGEAKIS